MNREEKRREWAAKIAVQQGSGLRVAAWCAANGIQQWQFHYWRKRLAVDTAGAVPHPGFVRLEPMIEDNASSGVSLCVGRVRVTLDRNFDASCLARVLELLGGARLC